LVTSCVRSAFENTLLKEDGRDAKTVWKALADAG
jgi:hypothetical protein